MRNVVISLHENYGFFWKFISCPRFQMILTFFPTSFFKDFFFNKVGNLSSKKHHTIKDKTLYDCKTRGWGVISGPNFNKANSYWSAGPLYYSIRLWGRRRAEEVMGKKDQNFFVKRGAKHHLCLLFILLLPYNYITASKKTLVEKSSKGLFCSSCTKH